MYENTPYYSSTYDEYKARQLKQKTGQDFLNDTGTNPQLSMDLTRGKSEGQPTDGRGGNNMGAVSSLAGLGASITSSLGPAPGAHGFAIDPYAGYTGSFNGLSSGGAIGAIAGGIAGEAGGFSKSDKAIRGYNASNDLGPVQYDANGKPIYNGAGVLAARNAANELHDAEMSATSWWQGGKAGGVAGIDSTTLFGELNGYKKHARRKRRETLNAISESQKTYNKNEAQYQQNQNQQQEYQKRLNNQNRMNNLYSIPTSYQQMF